MAEVTDLDVLLPDDRKVILKGRTWTLPGDMPLETYLKVNMIATAQEQGASEGDLVIRMVDALVDLFTRLMPEGPAKAEAGDGLRRDFMAMGLQTISLLLGRIYDDEEEVAAEPVEADSLNPSTPNGTSQPGALTT